MTKPRHGARVDDTHHAIVVALRDAGAKVLVLDVSEAGAPDVAVLWLGRVTLLELKSPGGRLSEEQRTWHDDAAKRGVRVHTAKTPREALDAIGLSEADVQARLRAMRDVLTSPAQRRLYRSKSRLTPAVRRWS